jgi:transketolase
MMEAGGRGHLASALSVVEILRVLYDDVLKVDPANPRWAERDRLILSKGHGCMSLYAILAEKGFFPKSELDLFCKTEGILGGHPEFPKVPGVEFSTGALGHGLPVGIGMAINGKYEKSDHRVFVIIGDGESNEGSVWEAALSAAQHKLDNLIVLVDYNKQQSYGTTAEIVNLDPLGDKWKAFGFGVTEVDGHDVSELRQVLAELPLIPGRPSVIVCHTIKGRGIDFVEGDLSWHHKSRISDDEIRALLDGLE